MMPPSPIRKLVPFADAAKKRGTKVYHLNIGQPDIVTPESILDAVRHTDMKVLEYSPSAGFDSYRKELVEYYKSIFFGKKMWRKFFKPDESKIKDELREYIINVTSEESIASQIRKVTINHPSKA